MHIYLNLYYITICVWFLRTLGMKYAQGYPRCMRPRDGSLTTYIPSLLLAHSTTLVRASLTHANTSYIEPLTQHCLQNKQTTTTPSRSSQPSSTKPPTPPSSAPAPSPRPSPSSTQPPNSWKPAMPTVRGRGKTKGGQRVICGRIRLMLCMM